MKLYSRYIFIHLLMPVIVITLTLTGIVWLTQSLRFIDLIVNRGLDITTFLYLSGLLIPSLLSIIAPLALFCSVLYTYNKLISDSELIVFRSAGLSRAKLMGPAIKLATLLVLLGYFITLYLLPTSYREFKDTQIFIRDHYASVLLQEGVFNTPTSALTVYIESRRKDGMLEGVLVYDRRDPKKPITILAKEGRFIQTKTGPRVDLGENQIRQVDSDTRIPTWLSSKRYQLDLSHYSEASAKRQREPEERYIMELFDPGETTKSFKNKLRAEGHHRLVWPLYSMVLALLGIFVLFTGQFNRRGQWRRILGATIAAVVVVGIHLALKNIIVSSPILAVIMYALPLSLIVSLTILVVNDRSVVFLRMFRQRIRSMFAKGKAV